MASMNAGMMEVHLVSILVQIKCILQVARGVKKTMASMNPRVMEVHLIGVFVQNNDTQQAFHT